MATILVVDDNPDIIYAIKAIAEKERPHYTVHGVEDAAACLQHIEEKGLPDAMLLDIMMPDTDGWALLKQLREDEATRGLPVIVVSAKGEVVDRKNLDLIGIQGYLQKPFDAETLLRVIDDTVSG